MTKSFACVKPVNLLLKLSTTVTNALPFLGQHGTRAGKPDQVILAQMGQPDPECNP